MRKHVFVAIFMGHGHVVRQCEGVIDLEETGDASDSCLALVSKREMRYGAKVAPGDEYDEQCHDFTWQHRLYVEDGLGVQSGRTGTSG
jgi:hypothetical protein